MDAIFVAADVEVQMKDCGKQVEMPYPLLVVEAWDVMMQGLNICMYVCMSHIRRVAYIVPSILPEAKSMCLPCNTWDPDFFRPLARITNTDLFI